MATLLAALLISGIDATAEAGGGDHRSVVADVAAKTGRTPGVIRAVLEEGLAVPASDNSVPDFAAGCAEALEGVTVEAVNEAIAGDAKNGKGEPAKDKPSWFAKLIPGVGNSDEKKEDEEEEEEEQDLEAENTNLLGEISAMREEVGTLEASNADLTGKLEASEEKATKLQATIDDPKGEIGKRAGAAAAEAVASMGIDPNQVASGGAGGDVNHYTEWKRIKAEGEPKAASAYYNKHRKEIAEDRASAEAA